MACARRRRRRLGGFNTVSQITNNAFDVLCASEDKLTRERARMHVHERKLSRVICPPPWRIRERKVMLDFRITSLRLILTDCRAYYSLARSFGRRRIICDFLNIHAAFEETGMLARGLTLGLTAFNRRRFFLFMRLSAGMFTQACVDNVVGVIIVYISERKKNSSCKEIRS